MINSGMSILSSGIEAFNFPNWENIKISVNYPSGSGQNSTNNKPASGDYVVDQVGRVWLVNQSTNLSNPLEFLLNLELKTDQPSNSIIPDINGTTQGLICTPTDAGLDPWWDATYISTAVYRRALSFSVSHFIASQPDDIKASVIGAAPDNLNSLEEIADAIDNDLNFAQSIRNDIQNLIVTADAVTETSSRHFVTSEQIIRWDSNAGTGGDGLVYKQIASNYNADDNEYLLTDSSSVSFSIHFPVTPIVGSTIYVHDVASTFAASPITIDMRGSKFNGQLDDVSLNINGSISKFVYTGTTRGWGIDIGGVAIGGGTSAITPFDIVTTSYQAQPFDRLVCGSTTTLITITLPSQPDIGCVVGFTPLYDWAVHNINVVSTDNIESLDNDLLLNVNTPCRLIYIDSSIGWKLSATS